MSNIDWHNLRSLDGSQNSAFEELCCQLAEYEKPVGSTFIRKGTPDAGVECFTTSPDKNEWGWQAKYFLSMGKSQWSQLDHSVKTALKKHSNLVKYTVCLPLDFPDARIAGQESLLDKWNNRVTKWSGWATNGGMNVQFEYWGSYQILERLSREEHRGRFFFWFGKEFFSQSWFKDRLQESIQVAGPRYTPEIHVDLPVAQLFEGLGRTSEFFIRIKHMLRDTKKDYSWIRLQNLGGKTDILASALDENVQLLFATLLELDKSLIDPIPWPLVNKQADQVLQTAYDCLEQLEELEKHATDERKGQEEKPSHSNEDRRYRDISGYIHRFNRNIRDLRDFSEGLQAKLCNLPALLLCGEAGQGKTHLFCDIAKRRIANGLPTILLMGQRFTQAEPWSQIMHQLGLPETRTRDDFLGALQAVAQARNSKALIMIDALNEGEGKKIWPSHLPALLQTLTRYPWISLAVSVRSSYEHVVIADELVDKELIRAEHLGFAEHEYQAARTFFDFYGIEQPSVPLLIPEFQNPLFLKLLCKGLHESNQSKFPVGLHGITAVFKFFIGTVNKKLSQSEYCGFDFGRQIVWQALDRLAEAMADKKEDWLLLDNAEQIINQILPGRNYENSLYRHLISEGVLVKNGRFLGQDEWVEVVQFAYEKFSDHIIVNHLLDKHLDINSPEQAFMPGQPLAFLTEKEWRHRGAIEALCIQMPELIGKELPEVAPMMADFYYVGQGFIQSLIWRNPKAIVDVTRDYLNKYASQRSDANDQILNALLTVATNLDHPYNAEFLHARLIKDEMAERDAWWSIFLHYQYGAHDAVDRLVDWAWSPENKHHIDDESIRLCGVALTWFLATSNRFLRDRATKALVNLFTSRLHVLSKVLEQFRNVNDPYISERLYAVAYGCALRSVNDTQIEGLAQKIYEWIFRDNTPPPHILLRDYARGVIEYALYRGIELEIEVDRIRPPYGSEWFSRLPESEEIKPSNYWKDTPEAERGGMGIYSSVMNMGDFSRYIIGTNFKPSSWLSLPLSEPKWQSSKEKFTSFISSLSKKQYKAWQQYQIQQKQGQDELSKLMESFLEKLASNEQEILFNYLNNGKEDDEIPHVAQRFADEVDITAINEIAADLQSVKGGFIQTLNSTQKEIFEADIIPYLNDPFLRVEPPYFDLSLAQRWIVKRVFDLGWTVKRFGSFDRHRNQNNYREARKAERIGKKYQWIAYHEFLARLADNFQFRDEYSEDQYKHQYNGPWQLNIRDIDPSCIIKETGWGDGWKIHSTTWWFPNNYNSWEALVEDVDWLQAFSDLPEIKTLIKVVNPKDDSKWLALNGHYQWEQPTPPEEDKYDLSRRQIWYILRSYLVNNDDIDELLTWAKEQNYMGRWMPETSALYNEVFLGEFYWSPAYEYYNDPYMRTIGWQKGEPYGRIPKPIMPTTDRCAKDDSGYDCSVDAGISISLPNQYIVEQMKLHWQGVEGQYFDRSGKLIVFDPSVQNKGPSLTLIDWDAFLEFLKENNLAILWTILGEKQLIGGGFRDDDWKGRLEINGAYRIKDGRLEGDITPRFHSPQERD
ncbi:MAG: ATP-binding protein [Anaerolineae bacterium]|nr:ATP-binding protein [Anaerolineae bacterium]